MGIKRAPLYLTPLTKRENRWFLGGDPTIPSESFRKRGKKMRRGKKRMVKEKRGSPLAN